VLSGLAYGKSDIGTITKENPESVERAVPSRKLITEAGVKHAKMTALISIRVGSETVAFQKAFNNYLYYRTWDELQKAWPSIIKGFMETLALIQAGDVSIEVVDLGHGRKKVLCYETTIRYFLEPGEQTVSRYSLAKKYLTCP